MDEIGQRLLGAYRTAHHAAMSGDEEEIRIADEYVARLEQEFTTAAGRQKAALSQLADPTNWIGDPMTLDAEFTGHFTPFELACAALADEASDDE